MKFNVALFKNEEKKKENQPDYRGYSDKDGHKYEVAGWAKEAKNGTKYISLSIKVDEEYKKETTSDPF